MASSQQMGRSNAGAAGESGPKLQMANTPQQPLQQSPMKSQQQQQQVPAAAAPSQDYNMVHMCRVAQELIHELISKIFEIFSLLKQMALPNGMQPMSEANQERRMKLGELLRALPSHVKNVRLCYEAVEEAAATHGLGDTVGARPGRTEHGHTATAIEQLRQDTAEYKDLMQQLAYKQRQIKEILDTERQMLWDINAMLSLKKS